MAMGKQKVVVEELIRWELADLVSGRPSTGGSNIRNGNEQET